MNVTTGWEALPVDELDPMAKVKMLPERYFSFLGNRMGNSQQIGSLLTAENLKAIKKYVNVVNQLPRTQAEIEREVDYGALGVDVTMVNDLYVALHRHVYEWDILERSIKQLGPEIELFAESLVQRGGNLLDNLENSEVFAALKKRKAEQGGNVYTQEFSEEEQAQITNLLTPGITELVREIESTQRRIDDVDARANWFNNEIKRELKPRMGRLLKHFDEKVSHEGTLEKRRQLDQWDEQIDQLKSEYDANVGYAFTGMVLGPIGLVITGGVFGSQAERIRATKNALIEQRDELARALAMVAPALKDFERVSTLVRDLQFRCKDLSAATKRLRVLLLAVERAFKESLIGGITLLEDRDFIPGKGGTDNHQRLASVLDRLSQYQARLVGKNLRLELFSLSAMVDSLEALAEKTATLEAQSALFEQRLVQLRQQRADIVQAIELFEKPSVASALKGVIPSDEEIDQIMGLITDPKFDANLFKAVAQKLASHADALEGARTFSDLGEARARLDKKIEEALGDQRQVQRPLQTARDELEAVKALSGVEPLKNDWLHELRKVELEWQARAVKLSATMDLDTATVALKELCEYLKAVQLMYDRS